MLTARPLEPSDLSFVLDYWIGATPEYLTSLGADHRKLPAKEDFETMLLSQLDTPDEEKKGFATIWCLDQKPIGHCNINQISYGVEAKMHLHLWKPETRLKGKGTDLVKLSLPYFFEKFKLQNLYCEPYAENQAPNKTLSKAGFSFVKKYRTIPGSINFEQEVNQWVLSQADFSKGRK